MGLFCGTENQNAMGTQGDFGTRQEKMSRNGDEQKNYFKMLRQMWETPSL